MAGRKRCGMSDEVRYLLVVIVTGDRHAKAPAWDDLVFKQLQRLTWRRGDRLEPHQILVIHGACRGIDLLADGAAVHLGYHVRAYPYPSHLGKRGGPYRNQEMLKEALRRRDRHGSEVRILAFHGQLERSKGTKDMLGAAEGTGIQCALFPSMHGDGMRMCAA